MRREIIPYRLKQARVSRCLSMLELSELVGVTKQAISQYELGRNEPSKFILNRIGDVLKYPADFFYKPLSTNSNSNSVIFFRSKTTSKVKEKNAAKEKIEIFGEISEYLEKYVDFPKPNFPKIEYNNDDIYSLDNDKIESYAKVLREYWGLGNGPIESLINTIQKNGVLVSKMKLKFQKMDAFSLWFNGKPFIFLNSDKNTNARIRFDMAHELGHLLMHADYYTEEDIKNKVIYEKIESEANRFAGALLLPRESFSKDVFSTSIDHFIQMKKKWKTSIAAMIYRCENLGILSDNQIKYLKDQMTKRVFWRREPLDDIIPVEKPFAHKQAVKLLLENNIITPSIFVEQVGCYADELEEYCFLEKGVLKTEEMSNVIKLRFKE